VVAAYETRARSAEVLRPSRGSDLPNAWPRCAQGRSRSTSSVWQTKGHRTPAARFCKGRADRHGVLDRQPGSRPAAVVRHRRPRGGGGCSLTGRGGPVSRRDPWRALTQLRHSAETTRRHGAGCVRIRMLMAKSGQKSVGRWLKVGARRSRWTARGRSGTVTRRAEVESSYADTASGTAAQFALVAAADQDLTP